MTDEQMRMEQARQAAMEKEYNKTSGGNYFSYVDQAKLEREGITQWKPVIGESQIRIVYPPDREGYFGLEIFKHSSIGVNRKTFICKKRMFDESCPICEFQDQLRKSDPSDPRVKELNPSRRYLYFVVDISSKKEEQKGKRWFDCPVTLFNEIKLRSKNKRRRGDEDDGKPFLKYINVSHPTDGRDIEFEQVKEQSKYSYAACKLVEGPPVPKSWYVDLPEFKDILKISDDEEMLDAVSDQFEDESNIPDGREPATRERSDFSDHQNSHARDNELEPEIETEVEDSEPERSQEPTTKESTREDIQKESEQETRGGGELRGDGPKDEEQDMKSRVQARIERARRQRRTNQGND
jgi:hypothetical protein